MLCCVPKRPTDGGPFHDEAPTRLRPIHEIQIELYAQEDAPPPILLPCAICSRTFMPQSLEKHVRICERAAAKKRKPFDSAKQRIQGTELAEFLPKQEGRRNHHQDERNGRPSWKKTHDDFLRAIREARGDIMDPHKQCNPLTSSGAPTRANEKGTCPTCNRHFGIKAYDRHVAWCKERVSRVPISPATNLAKERLEARMRYRAPVLKNRRAINREKYSPGSAVNSSVKTLSPTLSKPKEAISTPHCNRESPIKQKPVVVRRAGQIKDSVASTGSTKSRPAERINRPLQERDSLSTSCRPTYLPVPSLNFPVPALRSRINNPVCSNGITSISPLNGQFDCNKRALRSTQNNEVELQEMKSAKMQGSFTSARNQKYPKVNDTSVNENMLSITVQPCMIHKHIQKDDQLVTWNQINRRKDDFQTNDTVVKQILSPKIQLSDFDQKYLQRGEIDTVKIKKKTVTLNSVEDLSNNSYEVRQLDNETKINEVETMNDNDATWFNRIQNLNQTYLIKDSEDIKQLEAFHSTWKPIKNSPRVKFYFKYAEKDEICKQSDTDVELVDYRIKESKVICEDKKSFHRADAENTVGLEKINTGDKDKEEEHVPTNDINEDINRTEMNKILEYINNPLNNSVQDLSDFDEYLKVSTSDILIEPCSNELKEVDSADRNSEDVLHTVNDSPCDVNVEKFDEERNENSFTILRNKKSNENLNGLISEISLPQDSKVMASNYVNAHTNDTCLQTEINKQYPEKFLDSENFKYNEQNDHQNEKTDCKESQCCYENSFPKKSINLSTCISDSCEITLKKTNTIEIKDKIRENMNSLRSSTDSLISTVKFANLASIRQRAISPSFERETIHMIKLNRCSKTSGDLPEIKNEPAESKENSRKSIDQLYWEKISKISQNKLKNVNPSDDMEVKLVKRRPKVHILPPVLHSLSTRKAELVTRPAWNNYVRRRPDFNLVLKGRTGTCKDYDPFLLAEQQMNDLLSDTSDQSMTGSPKSQNRDALYPLSHSSAFIKYPCQTSSAQPATRSSLIAPPSEFDDLVSDFSSDSTETNSISREVFLKGFATKNTTDGSSKPIKELGRRIIIDKSKALGGDLIEKHSVADSAERLRKVSEKTVPKGSPKVTRPIINRSNSIRISSAPKANSGPDRKTSDDIRKTGSTIMESQRPSDQSLDNRNNNYSVLSGSNLSLSSIVSSEMDIKRSNSMFDELMTSFEEDAVFPSLRSFLNNESFNVSSPVHGNRQRNGLISDDELSSPDNYKPQDRSKMNNDSAYSSLNRKYSHHGRSANDVGGRLEQDNTSVNERRHSETSPSSAKMSKFCHECGLRFLESAKFCCECGVRRLAL